MSKEQTLLPYTMEKYPRYQKVFAMTAFIRGLPQWVSCFFRRTLLLRSKCQTVPAWATLG